MRTVVLGTTARCTRYLPRVPLQDTDTDGLASLATAASGPFCRARKASQRHVESSNLVSAQESRIGRLLSHRASGEPEFTCSLPGTCFLFLQHAGKQVLYFPPALCRVEGFPWVLSHSSLDRSRNKGKDVICQEGISRAEIQPWRGGNNCLKRKTKQNKTKTVLGPTLEFPCI